MTQAKYEIQQVRKIIKKMLAKPLKLDYDELMQKHKGMLIKLSDFGSEKDRNKIKEITRLALINTVRKISNSKKLRLSRIQKEHPGYDRVAKKIYQENNGKSPWQQLVEDAGIIYSAKHQKEWNLRRIIENVSLWDTENLSVEKIYRTDAGLIGATIRLCKNTGKAAIISGIDYLNSATKTRGKERIYSFSPNEIVKFATDKSLDKDLALRVTVNAFVLRYYSPKEEIKITLGEQPNGYRCCQHHIHFNHGLETKLEQGRLNKKDMRIQLTFNKRIRNRFQKAGIYFEGAKTIDNAVSKYSSLIGLISEVYRKLPNNH